MAKYNWIELEKDFILGDYKSINAFFEEKGIAYGKTARERTKDWKVKKSEKSKRKSEKVIEKVIEKESLKEAEKIVNLKDTAQKLLNKINTAIDQLDVETKKKSQKVKEIEYTKANKPKKEIINEYEEIEEYRTIINKSGLKQLTSALNDLNIILNQDEGKESKLDKLLNNIESIIKDD